jgi:RHS repeat-associated protein
MPGRTFTSTIGYKFGHGGQEKTDEVSGIGNHYTAQYWEYDPRLGRRWNVDPATKKHPNESPYLTYHNNPIFFTDPLGDDPPEGFKKTTGKGGDLYVPQSTTSTNYASDGGTYCAGDLESFTIGSKTFSAQYDNKGGFSGYFNGATKYENPDMTVKSGGTITGLNLNATFDVKNVPADGLQVVQTFYGTASALGFPVGSPYNVGGTSYDAFVDGGSNSPYVTLSGNSPAHPTNPYYNSATELASPRYANMTWNGNSGSITAYDIPTAMGKFPMGQFETSIIATNYMGTGKDVSLGTFKWGYTLLGTTPATQVINMSNMSAEHMGIIKQDYPAYQFFK